MPTISLYDTAPRAVLQLPGTDGLPSVQAEPEVDVVDLPVLAALAGGMVLGLIVLVVGVRHVRRPQMAARI